jgi:glyoxylase I family protein
MNSAPIGTIATTGFSHVRLTVTDIARSREFYESVFGWPVIAEVPEDADAATRERFSFLLGGVLYGIGHGALGLRPVGSDRFDEDSVGLDHVSFSVAAREDLDRAVGVLDSLGVPHEAVKEIAHGYILEFRDPDNIALELLAPKG